MDQPEQNRAHQIFLELIDLPDAHRHAALDAACGGDASLRAQVESLIDSHREAEVLMERPTASTSIREAIATPTESAGNKIGRYTLLQMIGEAVFAPLSPPQRQGIVNELHW